MTFLEMVQASYEGEARERAAREAELLQKLAAVQTMPELDELRPETVKAMTADGTQDTFDRVQGAFRKAKNRLRRIPLSERDW